MIAVAVGLLVTACAGSPFVPRPTPTRPGHEVHVQFQAGAQDVYPAVGDVVVVDGPTGGLGSAKIAAAAPEIVRQEGNAWRFEVLAEGVTTITLRGHADVVMVLYLRASART